MKNFLSAVLLISLILSTCSQTDAKPGKSKKKADQAVQVIEQKTHAHSATQVEEKEPWLKVQLSIPEKGILLRLADKIVALPQNTPQNDTRLPPGLAKNVARGKRLPPGWQRKLAIGKTFPATIYEQAVPLPPWILNQLPTQPQGTILVSLGGKVVRLFEATKTIADIFNLKW